MRKCLDFVQATENVKARKHSFNEEYLNFPLCELRRKKKKKHEKHCCVFTRTGPHLSI